MRRGALLTGGNTHEQGLLLLGKLLVGHAQDLDALDDTHDLVDEADDAAGHDGQNDTQDTGLGLTGHEAGNTDGVENSLY